MMGAYVQAGQRIYGRRGSKARLPRIQRPWGPLRPWGQKAVEGPRGPAQGGGLVLPCWAHPLITELGQSTCGKVRLRVRLRLSVRVRVR